MQQIACGVFVDLFEMRILPMWTNCCPEVTFMTVHLQSNLNKKILLSLETLWT